MGEKKRKHCFIIGIKWKMLFIIVIFIVCSLISIWFFQVRMLNVFYQRTKFYELDASAEAIGIALENDEVDAKNTVARYADDYNFDIWVLEISEAADGGYVGKYLITADGSGSAYLPFIKHKMETLCAQTLDNGGRYIATVPAESFMQGIGIEVIADNFGDKESFPRIRNYGEAIGTLHASIDKIGEKSYMIVQHANLTPLQTTITTLKYQFVYIGTVLVIMSVALAVILSKFITKPLVRMNESAKKLARGNYDADFTGHGYREIEELAMTLNYASRELAKTDNLQKELISNVSHDLRTPLTMIKGYSEVMRDIPGENTPENVQVVIDETARLSDLVNDMLDLSKIQSGARRPQFEKFNITETVRETLFRYEKLIMKDGYKIELDLDRDVSVTADRVMILQVIYNLINNAINYTGEDKYVLVRQRATETHVKISVTDTGEGIDKENLDDIWERYYRVDKVHKRAVVGTGLGLSIVKGVLELHGASFGVESIPGHGATFWFELELSELPEIINAEYENTDNGEK